MATRAPIVMVVALSLAGLGTAVAFAPVASAETSASPFATAPPAAPPPAIAPPVVEPPDDTGFVPGANDFGCRPSAERPRPVVLVHGTFSNMTQAWMTLSAQLKERGFCVYAFNYGAKKGDLVQGTGPIETSAQQMSLFVDKVLLSSGASQVDVVGHSQGGLMPRQYLKFNGGAAKVRKLVGLAPSNHGTNLNGLSALATENDLIGSVVFGVCPACTDQIVDSAFVTTLNGGGETIEGIEYTVIATNKDQVVTPFTSGFLTEGPNVRNILLQDVCADNGTEHIGITYDPVALQLTLNALDPRNAEKVDCG